MTTTAQLPFIIIIAIPIIIIIVILSGPAALHHWLISWRLFSLLFILFYFRFRFASFVAFAHV